MPTPRPRTIDRVTTGLLAAADGHRTHTTESTDGPGLDLLPVRLDAVEVFVVPPQLLPALCPDCDGPADLTAADPLAHHHLDERCEVAAEEEHLLRVDLARLARVGRRGLDRHHRLATPGEHLLLAERGIHLVPQAMTTVLALPEGGRRRAWSTQRHEPALAPTSE